MNGLFADTSRGARISADGLYRYQLVREFAPTPHITRTACFIMLNPSTADAANDDPTVRKCMGFARRWQCGRLVVVNLFAWRATDPAELKKSQDPVGPENDDAILAGVEAAVTSAGKVVCAWGVHGALRERNWNVLALIRHRFSPQVLTLRCLRHTKDGHPEHPLLVPYSIELKPYGSNVA